jgi:hypothetical protein
MAKMGIKALLKSNMMYWLEDTLLREGLYVNVPAGSVDVYGNSLNALTPIIDDPTYPSGTVWQSAFKNWVYESGITVTESGLIPPIICSGAFVNGVFYTRTDPTYGHSIDFPNGRIIFTAPQSSPIQAVFAYKMVTVDLADSFANENRPLLIETAYKDNPLQTGVQIYPTELSRTLPAIWIDITERTSRGYEIGSASLIAELRGVLHIWSRDGYVADLIGDILAGDQQEVIIGIDFNRAPYPLDEKGDKNSGFTSWDEMSDINHPLRWRRIYLDQISIRSQTPLFEVQRDRADFLARIYPNF